MNKRALKEAGKVFVELCWVSVLTILLVLFLFGLVVFLVWLGSVTHPLISCGLLLFGVIGGFALDTYLEEAKKDKVADDD